MRGSLLWYCRRGDSRRLGIRVGRRFFNGRKVVIFDDVITKGTSFATMVDYLEELGATVVGGIFLAATAFQHNKA